MYSNLLIGGADDKISNSQPESGASDEKIPYKAFDLMGMISQSTWSISLIYFIIYRNKNKTCPQGESNDCWGMKKVTFFTTFIIFLILNIIYFFGQNKISSPVVLSYSKEKQIQIMGGIFVGSFIFSIFLLAIINRLIPDEDNDQDNTNSPK